MSDSLHILDKIIDEIGYISYAKVEDFFDYAFPVIVASKLSKVIINSTKDYYEKSYFNKIWKDSEDGNNDFVRTTIKWYEIPKARPPAMAKSHMVGPDVQKESAKRNAPIGTNVAPIIRRPFSSAM